MKTQAVCGDCIKTNHASAWQAQDAPFYEDKIAFVECRLGHKTAMVIQNSKTEILLSSAAEALSQGFTFEAVASASAALERFYEFSLQVFFNAQKKAPARFQEFFKEMSNQSERQLGAFMLFHELELGNPFAPTMKMTTFRNSVIHKGKIPSVEDAESFCAYVFDTVRTIRDQLVAQYGMDLIAQTIADDVKRRMHLVPQGMTATFASILTLMSISSATNALSFRDAMQAFLKAREMTIQGQK